MFIVIASPTAAHAIARASHRSRIPLAKISVVDKYEEDKELKDETVIEVKEKELETN